VRASWSGSAESDPKETSAFYPEPNGHRGMRRPSASREIRRTHKAGRPPALASAARLAQMAVSGAGGSCSVPHVPMWQAGQRRQRKRRYSGCEAARECSALVQLLAAALAFRRLNSLLVSGGWKHGRSRRVSPPRGRCPLTSHQDLTAFNCAGIECAERNGDRAGWALPAQQRRLRTPFGVRRHCITFQ
jgi:hypothetical protein